jgi:hypothetical protein
VLAGAFTVIRDNEPTTYKPGEIFSVPADCAHSEETALCAGKARHIRSNPGYNSLDACGEENSVFRELRINRRLSGKMRRH